MKNKLIRNWGLKLVSFLFAIMLWVIVTNINDPVTPFPVSDVPVRIRNMELITERGQICEVLDGTDKVDLVTVYAPRSVIDSLSDSNVVAIADVKDLTSLDTVPIKFSTTKYNDKVENIKGSIDTVKLNIENKQIRSLPIKASVTGQVKEGYIVGDVSTEQNLIRVSGPESVVSRITKAQAEVDVSGFTSNIGAEGAEVRLYDAEGVEVRSSSLERSITKVRVNVEILEKKTVPLVFRTTGTPADGYRLTGEIESTRHSVVIAGKSKVVQGVSAIEIPEGVIDVTGAREDVTELIDLKEFMPEGTVLAEEEFTGMVNVTVHIGQEMRRTITKSVEDVRLIGVPVGYEAVITEPESACSITLTGLTEELAEIDFNTLEVIVDLGEWLANEGIEQPESGYYNVPLSVNLPEDTAVMAGNTEVQVHITERE